MNPLIHKAEKEIIEKIEKEKEGEITIPDEVDKSAKTDAPAKGKKGKKAKAKAKPKKDKKSGKDIEYDIELFHVGDEVKVYYQIIEGEKKRAQIFQGTVIAQKHGGIRETFTVRRIVEGEGVERIFPLYSPKVRRIEIVRRGRVRRAKLYYLRDRVGKARRLKELLGEPVQKMKRWEQQRKEDKNLAKQIVVDKLIAEKKLKEEAEAKAAEKTDADSADA